jgi:hypothetical protein
MPSHGRPGPSQKFQIAPRLGLPTLSALKKKAQINLIKDALFPEPSLICVSKIWKMNPPQVPQREWRDLPISRAFF